MRILGRQPLNIQKIFCILTQGVQILVALAQNGVILQVFQGVMGQNAECDIGRLSLGIKDR